jgi:hypothetical protein
VEIICGLNEMRAEGAEADARCEERTAMEAKDVNEATATGASFWI